MRKIISLAAVAAMTFAVSACGSSDMTGPSMAERRGTVKAMEHDPTTYKACKPREPGCKNGKKVKEREEWELTIVSELSGEEVEVDVDETTYDKCSIGLYFDGEECKESK